MTLKAVLFDFNGTIINDEPIHKELIEEILLAENLPPDAKEYHQVCLGRSDRACLLDLLQLRGRTITESHLNHLIKIKAKSYQEKIANLDEIPIYPDVKELIIKLYESGLKLAIVSGAIRTEIETILEKVNLLSYFNIIIGGDDIKTSKPQAEGYLLAVERLNQKYSDLNLQTSECLVIEDTFAGIEAGKNAQMQVLAISHTYPLHMLQRHANWAVDYCQDIDLELIKEIFEQKTCQNLPT